MFQATHAKKAMNNQDPSPPIPRTACQVVAVKGVSWTARTLSRIAAKLSHHNTSTSTQAFAQTQELDTVIEFLPMYQTRGSLTRDAPSITLTTPEGELITGDAIPKGTKCHFSDEYHTLQKQWLDTLENNLVPGNWKQLRDLNCLQEPKISYEEEEAVRERHLLVEEKKRKRHTEKAARRAHDEERRRQERDAAERAWQLQRMEIEYQKQERWYEAEERRYQAQQLKMQQADDDLGKWVEEMDRQQEEAERRLQELRDELEEKMERDFGVEGEDEL
ncbi:hypothetical protein ColTof4_11813 [Colletotrichum tofieldiae]|nr:hypothetical protein ColTof3_03112 [Colletotrichum tofieldiae]GKT79390.1 hypothetical protein ColTof4_11813 [Colletotrichum tofieldiae]GKT82563.1 hypothetical protein Ct61P_00413 [Colletotrichum tofieldiae]